MILASSNNALAHGTLFDSLGAARSCFPSTTLARAVTRPSNSPLLLIRDLSRPVDLVLVHGAAKTGSSEGRPRASYATYAPGQDSGGRRRSRGEMAQVK